MASLTDKVTIVTGAARGLGQAIAVELARRGCHIVVCDVNLDGAKAVAQDIESLGRRSLALQVDVSKVSDVNDMADRVMKEFGRID